MQVFSNLDDARGVPAVHPAEQLPLALAVSTLDGFKFIEREAQRLLAIHALPHL